jgi:hypothetical protein
LKTPKEANVPASGFDNISLLVHDYSPFTTIRFPVFRMGVTGAKQLSISPLLESKVVC